jgi:purine-binding chemotaxis protein CheW
MFNLSYYLIIKLGELQFGIHAQLVQEVVKLPEVSPVEEMPSYVRGLVNLRGKIIPVVDLNLRLGKRSQQYKLTDVLLILCHNNQVLGIICNEILEVIEISSADIESIANINGDKDNKLRLINSVARINDGLILLLDQTQLFHFVPIEASLDQETMNAALINNDAEINDNETIKSILHTSFLSGMSEHEKQEFKKRAQLLQQPLISEELSNSIPVAIIKLANEFLAVELNTTEGFANLTKLTPIPCCPSHIMGSMNLRGDHLTIVDIRNLLNISHTQETIFHNVMVIKCSNFSLGVPIDEIVDVVHLRTDAINKMPSTIDIENRQYLKGMVNYANEMLALVDIPKLLDKPELVVHEEI